MMQCAYCECEFEELHRDHVVPRSRGGPDDASNLVMACITCNARKSDQLASEWLGERCPKRVLLVEARVNAKLKAVFAKRDRGSLGRDKAKPVQQLFAMHWLPNGGVDAVGTVVSEQNGVLRLNLIDSFMAVACGAWSLSDEIKDIPASECAMFLDKRACLEAMFAANRPLWDALTPRGR